MMVYTLTEIATIVQGRMVRYGKIPDTPVRTLSFDSRTILSGKDTLFFALKNGRNDGHNYIADAQNREVTSFVVERLPGRDETDQASSYILVDNTLEALQLLAAHHRRRFSYPVTAITGSNGKTLVKEWLSEILGTRLHVVRSPRSYNSQIGNPLSVWLMDDSFDLALFEAGISKPGEMAKLEAILQPDHGIFTHLGNAHLENFSSVEALVSEKVKLFVNCQLIVYCKDFETVDQALSKISYTRNPRFFRWSVNENADLQILSKDYSGNSTSIKALYQEQIITLQIPFTDAAHIENAIHCWAYLLATGFGPGSFEEHFLHLSTVSMRLEIKKGINGCAIIDDSYNSDTASLINALDFLVQQNDARKLKSTLLLSDIPQSGKNPELLYREVAEYVRKRNISRLIGIGQEISRYRDLFIVQEARFYPDTNEFLLHFKESDYRDELILLKGARSFRFDRISSLLEEKKHQTVMEIDLGAMAYNLNHYRQQLRPGTKLMAMVKAFSYGTGSVEVAKILQFRRVDYLAVAIADEGVELRNAGIDLPIVVMNPEGHSFSTMIENRLEPNIYRFPLLRSFDEALKKSAVTNFPVHIKIDTGMKRLGFDSAAEIASLISFVQERDTLYIRSVFTHLAVSEDPSNDHFTHRQFELFRELSEPITAGFDYKILLHILNTAGIERFPEMQLDMVRLGIGLYGASSGQSEQLKNVATLKSTISQIKTVQPGETVGYGRNFVAERLTRIAVIPIGYADGYSRRLGNGVGRVIVKGSSAPIVGTVCMDMCMADVTGIACQEDDTVLLFGEGQPVSKVAEWMGTIPYEVLTTVGPRVKRIYFEE
ncbi:MAG: bifunctional UDP-N-acetylmuramoyl-tripeptide:D-alanyl-D-alanine ligase/alanine racemase [Bacteroidetes bacterium]|nr:bifunctional UDP-N-acetylmuramoyl-tripeptide:D-alanyl-D-alanine ligase/alanine racemase [Bacteroidota bacterium]